MSTSNICYIVEHKDHEDRLGLLKRAILSKFDSSVQIIKCKETHNESYLVLSKNSKGVMTHFILVVHLKRRLINTLKYWELSYYFEHDLPPYYECPKKFFDLCPTTDTLSLAWRNKIISIKEKRSNTIKNNNLCYKMAEQFSVGDVIKHPSYGDLKIQHICLNQKAFWCLNEKHLGVRKYKLPLMNVEDWYKNIEIKKSNSAK